MNKIIYSIAALSAAALTLTACTSGTPTTGSPSTGSNRPSDTAEAVSETTTEAPATTTTAAEPTSSVNSFGDSYTYENGLQITIGAPKPYTPSDSAFTSSDVAAAVKINVTVVNGTPEPFDPSPLYITMQSANAESEQIFDSANDMGGSPSTKVLPGREVTFDTAWAVTDPADLVLEATPGFEYESVLFSS